MTQDPFADPDFAVRYVDGPKRFVPGHQDMLRMSVQLLAEDAPDDANMLVFGAGGGIELLHFAQAQTGWRFTGVDPSSQMLSVARRTLGHFGDRCTLVEGTINEAPSGPFDGPSCLLTLHMIPDDGAKLATLQVIRGRLRPGAPFVVVDHCLDNPMRNSRANWIATRGLRWTPAHRPKMWRGPARVSANSSR